MKQQTETSNLHKRVRNMFINYPNCIAVRHNAVIYQLNDPKRRRGAWSAAAYKSINIAKRASLTLQKVHGGIGNGSVLVLQ